MRPANEFSTCDGGIRRIRFSAASSRSSLILLAVETSISFGTTKKDGNANVQGECKEGEGNECIGNRKSTGVEGT
jgi:hypothetical protein